MTRNHIKHFLLAALVFGLLVATPLTWKITNQKIHIPIWVPVVATIIFALIVAAWPSNKMLSSAKRKSILRFAKLFAIGFVIFGLPFLIIQIAANLYLWPLTIGLSSISGLALATTWDQPIEEKGTPS